LSLDLLELSDVMQQSFIGNDRFMFRVTAYQAAHEASEIGELRPRVEEDWKRVEALKLAHADAEAAMKNAASVGALASSTNGAGTSSVKITPREGAPESLGLSQVAGAQFVEKSVYALLDAKLENNLAVFDVPLADRSYVAQRSEIEPTWQTETDYLRTRAMESISLMSNLMMADFREPGLAPDRVTREYFDLENIYRRNNFVPELQGKDDDEPATQPAK
ncbi:MAG TPA: hypothetical protein PK402_00345, partial [Tepidisphaeraceae bacterium]|nr:hypothetical protein [Tepidisphaeraceae bacterium]